MLVMWGGNIDATVEEMERRRKKTYRKSLEENQALDDAFHGVAGQTERGAQMAPAFAYERRYTGRRRLLRCGCGGGGGGCCCCGCGRRGGGDQRWRLADGRLASCYAAAAAHHLADHVVRRPTAAHPYPPFQRFHQQRRQRRRRRRRRYADGDCDCGGGGGGGAIIRTTAVVARRRV